MPIYAHTQAVLTSNPISNVMPIWRMVCDWLNSPMPSRQNPWLLSPFKWTHAIMSFFPHTEIVTMRLWIEVILAFSTSCGHIGRSRGCNCHGEYVVWPLSVYAHTYYTMAVVPRSTNVNQSCGYYELPGIKNISHIRSAILVLRCNKHTSTHIPLKYKCVKNK